MSPFGKGSAKFKEVKLGVADRARKRMPAQGDYLEKDDLIRNQDEPFGVVSVSYDEHGGKFGPRWVLSLIPWYDEQESPQGLLTFTANPTRNPFFEDLQAQIEENNNEPIGPLTVVKGKSQKGFRYYTLDDWTEDGPAAGPAPEDAPPAQAQARPARPSAPAPQQEAAKSVPPASVPDEKPKRGPGRPRKSTTASTSTTTSSATPTAQPSTSTTPHNATQAAPPVLVSREPVPDPTGARNEAAHATEQVIPKMGKATCPDCHTEVEGRILPDDQGRMFIIHPFCPALGKATVVEYVANA